jgi:phage terminase small subunit
MATHKQRKAIDNLVENGGNVSKAMRDAGYSPETAKTPSKLTKSVAYVELMDAYLPDDMLLRALADDIESKEKNRKPELELAFKLKGRMTEKVDHTTNGKELPVPILTTATNVHTNDINTEDSSTD